MIKAVVDCGQLSLANGEVSYSFNTEYNSVATYSCNDSYWHKDKDLFSEWLLVWQCGKNDCVNHSALERVS